MKKLILLFLILAACSKNDAAKSIPISGTWSNSSWGTTLIIQPLTVGFGSLENKTGIGADCLYTYTATSSDPEDRDFNAGLMTISTGTEIGVQTESCNLTGNWSYAILANGALELCNSSNLCQWYY